MPPNILVICGPTASGKTALAVALALQHNGEVVSADSMQVYRGMDVGTAKPTRAEQGGVVHHMLDIAEPEEAFSVARYVDMASACVDDILARGGLPIIAGGTGLYIDALLAGLDFAPFTGGYRQRLQARASQEGMQSLYDELGRVDPHRAARLHLNDEKRIIRALEVFYETGETITAHDLRTKALPPRYDALRIGLSCEDRNHLWQRIDQRVGQMLDHGLEGEVRALLDAGTPAHCTAMQAIGYKELVSALLGHRPMAEAVGEVKLRSRQYAKRQLTWFRRSPDVKWIYWKKSPNPAVARQEATAYMEEFGLR